MKLKTKEKSETRRYKNPDAYPKDQKPDRSDNQANAILDYLDVLMTREELYRVLTGMSLERYMETKAVEYKDFSNVVRAIVLTSWFDGQIKLGQLCKFLELRDITSEVKGS